MTTPWDDSANWITLFGHGIIYSSRTDPRILVPKQPLSIAGTAIPLGWTLNMAHTTSKLLMATAGLATVIKMYPTSAAGGTSAKHR